jgi:xylulokinase
MEGVGYALQHNLKTSYEIDADVNELISVGGSANSAVWTQLKADITGKTIKVPKADEATGLGAAILAGVGTGCYENFEEAVSRTVKIQKEYVPNMKHHDIYSKYYDIYVGLYGRLKTSFDALAAIDE